MMSNPDKIQTNRVFEKSIPLIHKCMNERVSITLLLSTLKLIERGLIKEADDLIKFMERRAELNPNRSQDAQRIRELILQSYF